MATFDKALFLLADVKIGLDVVGIHGNAGDAGRFGLGL